MANYPSHFDLLCSWAEQVGENDDRRVLREAKLFLFEGRPGKPPADEIENVAATFHLPFPVVACEDENSCVLLVDDQISKTEKIGLGIPRAFVIAQRHPDGDSVGFGIIVKVEYDEKLMTSVHIDRKEMRLYVRNDGEWNGGKIDILDMPDEYRVGAARHLDSAFLQLISVISPKNFVLESSPVAQGGGKRVKKIPRSHQRPNYTLLRPNEIRRRMRLPDPSGDGATHAPHERRGHWRLLRDERYKRNEDGSVRRLWIDPMWIGPSENVVGNRRYKVIL